VGDDEHNTFAQDLIKTRRVILFSAEETA